MKPAARSLALLFALLWVGSAQALTYRCDRSGPQPVFYASGKIERDDAKSFRSQFLACRANLRATPIVDLYSGGGSLSDGLEAGEFLLGQRVHTRVSPGQFCISACTFMFLGGAYREVMSGASFEPHGFSGWRESTQFEEFNKLKLVLFIPCEDYVCQRLCQYLPAYTSAMNDAARWCLSLDVKEVAKGSYVLKPTLPTADAERILLTSLTKYLAAALVELERDVALRYLTKGNANDIDKTRYVNWILGGFRRAADFYLGKSPGITRDIPPDSEYAAALTKLIDGVILSSIDGAKFIRNFLAKHAASAAPVDEIPLVKLMFSTSIVYTRPLTNKEMCRAGIVTVAIDC